MIELYVLNELAAFPKYGTLTAVAEKMNVSQPALSRSMKKLEEDLGIQLFERGKNRIILNENGKIAAEYAQKVIDAETAFEKKVIEYEQTHRIFSFASIAPMPISELTPILSQQFIGMTVKSELKDNEKELYKSLDSGKSKLVVTLAPPKNTEKYAAVKLFTENLFIVLPKNHRLAEKDKISLKDLAGEKILIYSKLGFWYETTKKLIPNVEFFDQQEMSALRQLAKLTELPSFVTNFTIQNVCEMKDKKAVPISDSEVNVTFWCVCLKKNANQLATIFSQIRAIYGE
ncbi:MULTISPECIES: LysR family transcriptional regulator [unclassified Treponema]|uniref:LysR family transcriptional regulator n=1 Tax=unclassified Treponema TaxID=2638727 RepID=UPI000E99685B|nr:MULTISPECIES: LysR family transcriptional regulator [unclassified Treponema]HBP09155.1 LysR family transcriptional regulator [Treponema sp.]